MINTEQNNKEKFRSLYEEYYAPFCIYAKRFVDDSEIRQDIVSDVFASLWENIASFEMDSQTIIGYIKACVKNRCLNYLKHLNHEIAFAEQIQSEVPIYETEADSVYTKEEMYKMLYDALEKLPSDYRKVFIKSFFKGETRDEIAQEMDISTKSVGRYKQKAIELLREDLKYIFFILFIKNNI